MGLPGILKVANENVIIKLSVEINVREVKLWIEQKEYWN